MYSKYNINLCFLAIRYWKFNCYFPILYNCRLVGDLLLMEIWECLTQGHMRVRSAQNNGLQMRIASLPPVPSQERCFELFNLSVDSKFHNMYSCAIFTVKLAVR